MKRKVLALACTLALSAGLLAGCGSSTDTAAEAESTVAAVESTEAAEAESTEAESTETAAEVESKGTITVAATPVPHAEILEAAKDLMAAEGWDLEIVEFTDYVQPNLALNDKNLDANYFQHKPYLDEFVRSRNLKLVSAGAIHLEPMSVFSKKIKDLKDLPDGARVAIPNDPTNGGRALLVLQSAGLIKLRDGAPITATPQDITENKKNLQFSELEAPQLPRSLEDADISVININFALEAKLNPKDAIFTESSDSPYANIVAVREGDENRPEIKKLIEALTSQESKDFIEKKYNGAIKTAF